MAAHTPGPWTADLAGAEHGQHAVNEDTTKAWAAIATAHVGRLGGGSRAIQPDEAEANARLIAAAPDLLAACESLMALFAGSDMRPEDECHALYVIVEAAIAKAQG